VSNQYFILYIIGTLIYLLAMELIPVVGTFNFSLIY